MKVFAGSDRIPLARRQRPDSNPLRQAIYAAAATGSAVLERGDGQPIVTVTFTPKP